MSRSAKKSDYALKRHNTVFSKQSIFIILTSLLLTYPVFFRGLFFEEDQLIAHIISCLLFGAYLVFSFNSSSKARLSILDFAVLAYFLSYVASTIISVNMWLGIKQLLNIGNLCIVYILVSRLNNEGRYSDRILNIMYLGAVAVAAIGVLASLGIPVYDSAFSDDRISSTFQYSNVLASYLIVFLLCGLYLLTNASSSKGKLYLYSIGNLLIAVAMIGTKSRGGFLVALLVLVLYAIINTDRISNALLVIANLLVAIPVSALLFYLSGKQQLIAAFFVIIIGFLLIGPINVFLLQKHKIRKWMIITLFVLFAAACLILIITQANVLERFIDIKISDLSVSRRFEYYKDGLEMIKERPLFGYGGGGWVSAYKAFRSVPYYTTEIHNHIIQTAIETGIIGLLSFLSVCVFSIIGLLRKLDNPQNKLYLCIILAMLIHSLIDFNFSLVAYSITFFGFIALSSPEFKKIDYNINAKVIKATGILILIPSLIFCTRFLMSDNYVRVAKIENAEGNIEIVYDLYTKANKLNPFKTPIIEDFARINEGMYQVTKENMYLERAEKLMEKAIGLDPLKPDWYSSLALYRFYQSKLDEKTFNLIQKSIDLDPYGTARYIDAGRLLLNMARITALQENDPGKARMYLKELINLGEKAVVVSKLPGEDFIWYTPKPVETSFIQYVTGAYILLNDIETGKTFWEKNMINSDDQEKLVWIEPLLYRTEKLISDENTIQQISEVKMIIELLEE